MANYSDLTAGTRWGWLLTIDACPYAFSTAGVTAVSFTGTRPDDYPTSVVEPVIVHGGLVRPPAWSEKIEPLEGRLVVDGVSFELRDPPDSFGGPAGTAYNILTWMTSRQATLASTPLDFATGTLSAAATTIVVSNGSIFGSTNFNIWIGREAIRISSRTSNTLTVAGSGRGILGSKARAHRVAADASFAAEVYSSYPGPAFARCVLWVGLINSSGSLVDPIPLYRGRVQHAPRLKRGNDVRAGTIYELACDHVSVSLDKVLLGSDGEACRTAGYVVDNEQRFKPFTAIATVQGATAIIPWTQRFVGWPAPTSTPTVYASLPEYVAAMNATLRTSLAAGSPALTGNSLQVTALGDSAIRCSGRITVASYVYLRVRWDVKVSGLADGTDEYAADAATGTAWTSGAIAVPRGSQPVSYGRTGEAAGADANYLYVSSVANLTPISRSELSESGVPFRGQSVGTLFSSGDSYVIQVNPANTARAAQTVIDTANRRIRAGVRAYDKFGGPLTSVPDVLVPFQGVIGNFMVLLGELVFQQGIAISGNAWPYLIKWGIIEDTIYSGTVHEFDVDSRDWEWSYATDLATDTPLSLRARAWQLTGQQNLKDLIEESCQFAGAAPTLRRSQISLRSIRVPLRSDIVDSAHTLSYAAGTVIGKAEWEQNRTGIANVGKFTIGDDETRRMTFQVNAQRSRERYGQQREVEVKVRGITVSGALLSQGSRAIADWFTRRIEGLWSEPTDIISVRVPIRFIDSIYLLDNVTLTHWLPPNASGTRALATATAVVVGRKQDPNAPSFMLELMRWPHFGNVSGFSPCCRVGSISAAVLTITTAYANSSDYAGSNLTGYANTTRGTVANDGGTGYFAAGDRVELVERGNAAPRAPDSFIVSSVSAAGLTITLTASPNAAWQTIITGGGIVDVRYDDYATSGLQTAQKTWAWIADRATRAIGGTADDRFRWAP